MAEVPIRYVGGGHKAMLRKAAYPEHKKDDALRF
jgi:hypothetical protein